MKSHSYLFIMGLILLTMLIIYIYIYDHKKKAKNDYDMIRTLKRNRFTDEEIDDVSHDDRMWYYKNNSTCVGFGNKDDRCYSYENICSSDDKMTYGSLEKQIKNVKMAIDNDKMIHPDCPLIY